MVGDNYSWAQAWTMDEEAGYSREIHMVTAILPAYNEELAIEDELRVITTALQDTGYPYELVVVDDGSTDRTGEIARRFPGVRVIRHRINRGPGAARTTGILAAQGDVVFMTDADGTYPNQDLPRLISGLTGFDMVVGARVKERGTMPWLRMPTKWFIRTLASYLTGTHIPDLNSGMRAVRREIALRYLSILPNTHSWVSTITLALLSDGYPVQFVPIDYYPRKGRSSFHPIRDTYNYLSLVIRAIMYFNPLKIFLPISTVLLIVAFLKLIRDMIDTHSLFYVPGVTLLLIFTAFQILAIGLLADLIVRKTRR